MPLLTNRESEVKLLENAIYKYLISGANMKAAKAANVSTDESPPVPRFLLGYGSTARSAGSYNEELRKPPHGGSTGAPDAAAAGAALGITTLTEMETSTVRVNVTPTLTKPPRQKNTNGSASAGKGKPKSVPVMTKNGLVNVTIYEEDTLYNEQGEVANKESRTASLSKDQLLHQLEAKNASRAGKASQQSGKNASQVGEANLTNATNATSSKKDNKTKPDDLMVESSTSWVAVGTIGANSSKDGQSKLEKKSKYEGETKETIPGESSSKMSSTEALNATLTSKNPNQSHETTETTLPKDGKGQTEKEGTNIPLESSTTSAVKNASQSGEAKQLVTGNSSQPEETTTKTSPKDGGSSTQSNGIKIAAY
jgi:hypothetical protein